MRVLNEAGTELAVENLDHRADHFTDLIEEERLAFEVEAHEFNRLRVIHICHLEAVSVYIHELVRCHVHHVAHGGRFMGFDLLRVVVILFRAFEFSPKLMQLRFLVIVKSRLVHSVNGLLADVRDVAFSVHVTFFVLIFDTRLSNDLLDASRKLADNDLLRLFFSLLLFCDLSRRRYQVQVFDRC